MLPRWVVKYLVVYCGGGVIFQVWSAWSLLEESAFFDDDESTRKNIA
jgi:hypothetical protein